MDANLPTSCGAVVLCGGASSRIGRDKAWLPFGPNETLLQRVLGILGGILPTANIVVVAAQRQRVPAIATDVRMIHESGEGAGPLPALAMGLAALPDHVVAAFACGCDAPFLQPAFVARLLELACELGVAIVPADDERMYPLAAAYRTDNARALRAAIDAGERSLHGALRGSYFPRRDVAPVELRSVDPALDSLLNCNTPEEYEAALQRRQRASP